MRNRYRALWIVLDRIGEAGSTQELEHVQYVCEREGGNGDTKPKPLWRN